MKKKVLSRLMSFYMVLTMMLCIVPTASAASFSDVPTDAWYREAVDYVSDNGLMAGTGNGQFSPNATMSRAMLVVVLYRMEGSPAASGNGGFSDVPANAYYTAAVAWAAGNQLVSGTGNGNFSPDALISRQQLATVLFRYASYKNYDTATNADVSRYADASTVSSYAQDAMRWAVGAGIISGSDGRLMPSGSATRAQAAAMLMRFAQGRTDRPGVQPQPSESRILIAYFSRANFVSSGTDAVSGATASAANTKTVAEHIQRTVGGDLFEIVPERDYPESHSEASAIAGQELEDNVRPELTTHVQNMADYGTIILGYPAWHHTAPMAVRTFLEEYDFTGKTIIPYMTSLGNSVDQSVSDIRTLCPTATVLDGIAFTHGSSNRWNEQATQWLNGLDIFSADSTAANPTHEQRMKITVGEQVMYATLADNATAHAIAERLPLTLELLDLYGREMCYHFADELPANEVQTRNFELGEIIYWPPRHSFVIMYKQDGEQFSMQHVGQLENVDDVAFFGQGSALATFELVK